MLRAIAAASIALVTSAQSADTVKFTKIDTPLRNGAGCEWRLPGKGDGTHREQMTDAKLVADTDFRSMQLGLNGLTLRAPFHENENAPWSGAYDFAVEAGGLRFHFKMVRAFPKESEESEIGYYSYLVTIEGSGKHSQSMRLSGMCGA